MNISSDNFTSNLFGDKTNQEENLKGYIKSALKNSFNLGKKPDAEIDDLFTLIQLIDNVLSSNITLTKQQINDYCKSQRYFMKLYMKKVMEKKD